MQINAKGGSQSGLAESGHNHLHSESKPRPRVCQYTTLNPPDHSPTENINQTMRYLTL